MIEYRACDCVTFFRSKESYGGLGNMAGGYGFPLGAHMIRSTEHLYQALRFPDHPELQLEIIGIASPIFAKRKAHGQLALTRPDWDDVKIDIMTWCLDLKTLHHPEAIKELLRSTGTAEIVEASPRDGYYGAIPSPDGLILRGLNILGRLWRMQRQRLDANLPIDLRRSVIDIPNFRFAGEDAMMLALT